MHGTIKFRTGALFVPRRILARPPDGLREREFARHPLLNGFGHEPLQLPTKICKIGIPPNVAGIFTRAAGQAGSLNLTPEPSNPSIPTIPLADLRNGTVHSCDRFGTGNDERGKHS